MPSFKITGLPVLEKKILKVFAIYRHGLVNWTVYTIFHSPFLRMLHIKFDFNWPSGFIGNLLNCERQTDDGPMADAGAWVYYKTHL